MRVPADVQPYIGKREMTKGLGTQSLTEAKRRLRPVLAGWESDFDVVRKEMKAGTTHPSDPLIAAAVDLRTQIACDKIDPADAGCILSDFVDRYLQPRFKQGNDGRYDVDDETLARIRSAHSLVNDHHKVLLSDALKTYLEEDEGRIREQTLVTRKRRIQAFIDWFGGEGHLSAVTQQKAGEYVTQIIQKSGLAVSTKRDTVNYLSSFFEWCRLRKGMTSNPFYNQSKLIRETSRGTPENTERRIKRKVWPKDYLLKLIQETDPESNIWIMSVLALYTGMRSNEIAEIKLENVHDLHIYIPEAKTKSGVRDVPLHPVIKPLVHWLRERSSDGYLVSGLKRGGPDNKRNHRFVKDFGRYLRGVRGLNIQERGVVFHTLRNSWITTAENVGIPESTINRIVGHEQLTISLGRYSRGLWIENLQKEVKKVKFSGVDPVVRRIVKKLVL